MPAFAGAVYQNPAGDMHVVNYSNSLHSLYYGLDQPVEGGAGHGERLARMGFQAIRVYQLPVENQDDANRTREIFRRLYGRYGIKVLVGDWAGLHTGIDFRNTKTSPASARMWTDWWGRMATSHGCWAGNWEMRIITTPLRKAGP
jgi:hypothetical protein